MVQFHLIKDQTRTYTVSRTHVQIQTEQHLLWTHSMGLATEIHGTWVGHSSQSSFPFLGYASCGLLGSAFPSPIGSLSFFLLV